MAPLSAPFPAPLQCLFEPKRYKVLWGGRGAGRSWGVARALLLIGAQRPTQVLCGRELQLSIDQSVHKLLSEQIDELGLGGFYQIQKAAIIGANGTIFHFAGIKNNTQKIKSFEGIDICWIEEANKVSKSSWGILIPTIRKTDPKTGYKAEIWMTLNPELDTDETYVRFVKDPELRPIAKHRFAAPVECEMMESSHSFVVKMTYKDNPWFPDVLREEMERDRRRPGYEDYFLNVWEGHTLQMLEGAVYASQLRALQLANQICTVPWDRDIPVDTFWDLGRADKTAIWFAQKVAMQTRVLDYVEGAQEDITFFLRELQRKGYVYGTIHLPHDAKAKRLGSKHTIEEVIRNAGYRVNIVPKLSRTDGINAARLLLSNCWFDEDKCEDGLNALRHYRYKVVDGQLSNEPLHDWASDGADAFRYMAIAMKNYSPAGSALTKIKRMIDKRLGKGGDSTGTPLGWMS